MTDNEPRRRGESPWAGVLIVAILCATCLAAMWMNR